MRYPALLLCLLSLLASAVHAATPEQKLNVVLILADDLGWTDLGCFGSDLYQTPNLDRLAREGMRFTQAYSACTVCSPTRASLLSGKYPARVRVTDWIPGRPPANPKLLVPDWTKYLPHEEVTLAEAFKAAGYRTASIGKWHLGPETHWPTTQGFEVNIAGTEAGSPLSGFFAPWKIATLPEGAEGDYLTDRMGMEAAKYVKENAAKPFFLYLPHFAVHTPIQGPKDLVAKYEKLVQPGMRHTNAKYAAMVESMDTAIGRVLTALEEQKILDRTVIVFTSDNGGHLPTTTNVPLRVGKGSCYEGGTRVPLIVRWPGGAAPGGESAVPVITPDLYPTLLALTGVPKPPAQQLDGENLEPLLRRRGGLKRDAIFWHYPHYQLYQQGGTVPYGAIRAGDFKLIEFFDGRASELYNLRDDLSEKTDLAAKMPDKVRELHGRLTQWQRDVGAQLPARNPAFDPSKPEHDAKAKKKRAEK
ncbi:MAG: sulfatase [Verrucomicrobiota bacterium]